MEAKPSFTQYRAPPAQPDSPFSSPASKPDEADHLNNQPSSGTLGSAGGPSRKRVRGHGYSSSWNGGSLQQHYYQQQQQQQQLRQQQQRHPQRNSLGHVPGLSEVEPDTSPSDPGADISPQNPPSGSFGPAIQSLSLGGDYGQASNLATLFPDLFPDSDFTKQQANEPWAGANEPFGPSAFRPAIHPPTEEEQQRAREQVRKDLAGVDERALKGPLRDIMQQRDVFPAAGLGAWPGVADQVNAGQPPAATGPNTYAGSAAQQAILFPSSSNPSVAFNGGQRSWQPKTPQRPSQGRRRSSSLDLGTAPASQGWSGQPTNSLNAFDLQGLAAQGYGNQFQPRGGPGETTPTGAFNPAAMPNGNPVARRVMTRDRSGQTVSPQEAFLDYNTVESAMSGAQGATSNVGGMQSLFAPVPASITDALAGDGVGIGKGGGMGQFGGLKHSSRFLGSSLDDGGQLTPKASDAPFSVEPTPPLTIGSSSGSGGSRDASMMPPSPCSGEGKPKQRTLSADTQITRQNGSQSSGLSLFSPTDSQTTSTDDDDEDERPYAPPQGAQLRGQGQEQYPFPNLKSGGGSSSTLSGALGSGQADTLSGALGENRGANSWAHVRQEPWAKGRGGPRFSAVSTSSSDSEDNERDVRRGGGGGGAGAGGLPEWSRGQKGAPGGGGARPVKGTFLGGYGYMPGSAESGLSYTGPPQASQASTTSSQSECDKHREAQSDRDVDRISPSIRSSAKTINLPGERKAERERSRDGRAPRDGAASAAVRAADEGEKEDDEDEGEDAAAISTEESEYEDEEMDDGSGRAAGGGAGGARRDGSVAGQPRKAGRGQAKKRRRKTTARGGLGGKAIPAHVGGPRRSNTPLIRKGSSTSFNAQGTTGSTGRTTHTSLQAQAQAGSPHTHGTGHVPGGHTTSSGLTKCDYLSPLNGSICGTEFHRPYDLARHRETIHAREEAQLVRQGKLSLENCVVLGKEVDPSKSASTVEWRCDGKNGCGGVFSRKDALIRHRRIRGHGK